MKRKPRLAFIQVLGTIFLAGALGCASSNQRNLASDATPAEPAVNAYQAAIDQAFSELKQKNASLKTAASSEGGASTFKKRFSLLPAHFDMVVFPKHTNVAKDFGRKPAASANSPSIAQAMGMTKDELRSYSSDSEFETPRLFHFEVVKQLDCKQAPFHGKVSATKDSAPTLQCAKISITPGRRVLRGQALEANPARAKLNELVQVDVYIDSQFRTHAVDYRTTSTLGPGGTPQITTEHRLLKWNRRISLTSGLTTFPIDLPNIYQAVQKGAVHGIDDAFVKTQLQSLNFEACASDSSYQYKDLYGNRDRVSWCEAHGWPSVIENNRFLAVLKP
jgi:hypothetical protein